MGECHSRGRLIPLPHGAALFRKLSYQPNVLKFNNEGKRHKLLTIYLKSEFSICRIVAEPHGSTVQIFLSLGARPHWEHALIPSFPINC